MKKDIETTIGYWRDPNGAAVPNIEHDAEILLGHLDEEKVPMLIQDMRGAESSYTLDTQGFTVRALPTKPANITDQAVDGPYFQEISKMIKELTGAKDVKLFAKVVRQLKRDALEARNFKDETGKPRKVQAPSPRAHTDFAADYAEENMNHYAPGSADLIKDSSRWQILGIWTPLKVVQRDPLCIADARTVPDSDLFDLSREKTWGKEKNLHVTTVRYGNESKHQWYYLSDMRPEEALVFKHFDSKRDIPAWRCVHTSVEIPGTADLPPRESIEVRALVFY